MVKKRKLTGESKEDESVQIEFALFEPDESDFHGVKPFFIKAWDFCKEPIMCASELSEVVSGQGNIGNVIKTDQADPNSFGILSIINLKQYQKEGLVKSIPQLFSYLRKKCKKVESSLMPKLKELLHLDRMVGLVINERILTLPTEIMPLLHENLVEDVRWSQTTPECPEEERPFYFFDTLIGLCAAFKNKDELVYTKFEDEAYVRHSSFHFSFPVRDTEHRVFFALDYKDLPKVIEDIRLDAVSEANPAANVAVGTAPGQNTGSTAMKKKKKRKV